METEIGAFLYPCSEIASITQSVPEYMPNYREEKHDKTGRQAKQKLLSSFSITQTEILSPCLAFKIVIIPSFKGDNLIYSKI